MSRILEFMNQLDQDASLRASQHQDPVATMKRFGLSNTESQLMLGGVIKDIAFSMGIVEMDFHAIDIPQAVGIPDEVRI